MEYRPLGKTGIDVSLICLGTMTYGEQNTESDAHEQLDFAVSQGINFIDTAEIYPVPPVQSTQGLTETYIGTWLAARKCRDKVVLATKVAGASDWLPHIRNDQARLDRNNIEQALNASLKRLKTDYIDLYQLHWPDRTTNFFGQLGFSHKENDILTPIEETLGVLDDLVRSGKIRAIGISNEVPWGTMKFLEIAALRNLPRIASIQNPYNLINRTFEIGLAEIAHREQVSLLAYSPLSFGVLTGKYLNGAQPAGARLTLFDRFDRYKSELAQAATAEYVQLAHDAGLRPAQMALAYVNSRSFITSNIIGATTMAQLKEDIGSLEIELGEDVLNKIEEIHTRIPNPSP
ncbi:MAG: NADP(H)-dependent aldo-keto reductase [Gammaproteobacteria bacterium]|nr:MAG: NADP(H)-dependent aldo-keto reductase [Gammaproteobacteria bacterium]